MKVTESTDTKGRRKVVATNDGGEAPLGLTVTIVDGGMEAWLKPSALTRSAQLGSAARTLMALTAGAWRAYRAGLPKGDPLPGGAGHVFSETSERSWTGPSPSSVPESGRPVLVDQAGAA